MWIIYIQIDYFKTKVLLMVSFKSIDHKFETTIFRKCIGVLIVKQAEAWRKVDPK